MPRNAAAYDDDFYAWTQEQARLIRTGSLDAVDLENVAEEIESMGRSDKREIRNRLAVVIAHLLKWSHQPARRARSWRLTLLEQRRQVVQLLSESPSLDRQTDDLVIEAYSFGRLQAARETGLSLRRFPETCPYAAAQVLDVNFLPDA